MTVKQAQEEVNSYKSHLIEILYRIEAETKRDEKKIEQLDRIICRLEAWQNS